MKIAFATNDLIHINAHFGWAKQLAVYDVTPQGFQFIETLEFAGDLKEDGNEDKLVPKLEALADCTIVYVSAIGGSAAARLIRRNVTPIKANSEDDEIIEILNKLVQTLNGNPPPWLRKVLKQQSHTLDELEEVTV
ncbi:nitrogen fixation protein NifX [Desertifilum sp. FACHB-1129]|uniref:Nitrogen fixation protein NifX n=1 Tax=Desertifilum tharense IPPAS B-1220 TaxID=1781255 RepID=A0A1E5QEN8_9CYAN|nr:MULTISPECIES: nitrogen fixation protein NifX [Desertifilum]MDA0212691.1 nitrogen fixation protein NifX [Cyanobacteria bacterium FC1]MBD2313079.1 nitrogen fixation protein NifX [Desertifilum sp. FACHB-1129]MBD2324115.1 nitrogen fixation protein NifX [Desertifilum sp. FACHB-866]MBD2334050.1 nitrogen fixation protein NifX [Desertifilum sp. FACHB-868]OEJ73135.1 nitrogen fixation protein NifX [Desertifilum tharense IPPAS B-1220]